LFPYYVKNRGWFVPGVPTYAGNTDILDPEIRNFLPVSYTIDGDTIDFYAVHNYLTYSNPNAGYHGRPGIQFPSAVNCYSENNSFDTGQALVVEDMTLPPREGKYRDIFVDFATTENLTADYNGRLWGKTKTIDETTTAVSKRVLVKNQDNPQENGIYYISQTSESDATKRRYPWIRITRADDSDTTDDYTGARIIVTDGSKNFNTVWYSTTPNPVLGEEEIFFEQDTLVGVYKDDFCVESYFKVASFLQPAILATAGAANDPLSKRVGGNMTLIDTYYRDNRDAVSMYSGLRIYFKPAMAYRFTPSGSSDYTAEIGDGEKTGYLFVDIGTYDSPTDQVAAEVCGPLDGPALRTRTPLSAGVFYHVAVVREKDVFSLYVDGILHDRFISQDTTFAPVNRTSEQNSIRYRGRAFFGDRPSPVTQYARFVLRPAEFYFDNNNSATPESKHFNGADLLIYDPDNGNKLINLPVSGGVMCQGKATWPGRPIPDYPAPAHVYIVNNSAVNEQAPITMAVHPSIRFPVETVIVDLATVPYDEEYVWWDGKTYPVPQRGNISLYGLTGGGSPATGTIVMKFSSLAAFTIPFSTVFIASNGMRYTPRFVDTDTDPTNDPTAYSVITTEPLGGLGPGQLLIESNLAGNYVVTVPVRATTNGQLGNISLSSGATFSTTSTFANLVNILPASNFVDGTNDGSEPKKVDGVTVEVGMRILVKNQLNAAANGIYVVAEEAWPRAAELNTTDEIVRGRRFFVRGGYTNSNSGFLLSVASNIKKSLFSLGSTPITFPKDGDNASYDSSFIAIGFTGIAAGDGLEVSDEPADVVKCCTRENITLSGLYSGSEVDNATVNVGNKVLVAAQTDQTENGVYIASTANWERVTHLKKTSQFVNNLLIAPTDGDATKLGGSGSAGVLKIAYRMLIPPNFILGDSPITFTTAETLTKLHLPFAWRKLDINVPINTETGLSTIKGGKQEWEDTVYEENDMRSFRVLFQCGKTIKYSRSVILRDSTKFGILSQDVCAAPDTNPP
jgi:hypothetical protein